MWQEWDENCLAHDYNELEQYYKKYLHKSVIQQILDEHSTVNCIRKRDNFYIDWELNEVLDINGWDLKKALQHFHKSNATLFEWSNSPVIYYTTDEWKQIYDRVACNYFACKSALYHYYGTANKNYHEYLCEDIVKYKKYFYVLRPILACKWIEEKKCPPPVLFDELFHTVLEDDMKAAVEGLLAKKVRMSEADKAPKIEVINQYIEEKLSYYKALVESMTDDRNPDWEPLEREFIGVLNVFEP